MTRISPRRSRVFSNLIRPLFSFKVTDRSFRYASPRHPASFSQPRQSRLTSSFTCQLISIIVTTLVIHHSFTLSLQAQNLPFQQILPWLPTLDPFFHLPDCPWTGPITLIGLFLVSHFNFLFVPCGGLSWLPVSFLLHVKCTISYRIVSSSKVSVARIDGRHDIRARRPCPYVYITLTITSELGTVGSGHFPPRHIPPNIFPRTFPLPDNSPSLST